MKVLDLRNGTLMEYNDSYGARLLEQGKAVLAPENEAPAKEETDAETPAKGKRGNK